MLRQLFLIVFSMFSANIAVAIYRYVPCNFIPHNMASPVTWRISDAAAFQRLARMLIVFTCVIAYI